MLVYSEEAMVPFSISADMTLKEATDELVKVRLYRTLKVTR